MRKALATPEVKERFVKLGLTPVGSTSAEFRAFLSDAIQRFGEAASVAGLKPE